MRFLHARVSWRGLIVAAALALGLAVGPLGARGVGATFSTCDLDPVVVLSNGVTLSITAHVQAQASDIQQVTYTVHGPVGTSVASITYDSLGSLESLQYIPDLPGSSFTVSAQVLASTPSVGVTTSTTVTPSSGHGGSGDATSGDSHGDGHGNGHHNGRGGDSSGKHH